MSQIKLNGRNSNSNGSRAEISPSQVKVYQDKKISFDLNIRHRGDLTERQIALLELILDKNTKVVFLSGPAGSSKSYTSILAGLELLQNRRVSSISYVRPIVESAEASSKLGYLPGSALEKLAPYSTVLEEKLSELIPDGDIKKLNAEDRLNVIPVNFARGANWAAKYIFVDEAQSYSINEIKTLLTRIAGHSKMVIAADPDQSDLPINKQGGFSKVLEFFNSDEARSHGIFCVELTEEDIVRSEICKYIVNQFKQIK